MITPEDMERKGFVVMNMYDDGIKKFPDDWWKYSDKEGKYHLMKGGTTDDVDAIEIDVGDFIHIYEDGRCRVETHRKVGDRKEIWCKLYDNDGRMLIDVARDVYSYEWDKDRRWQYTGDDGVTHIMNRYNKEEFIAKQVTPGSEGVFLITDFDDMMFLVDNDYKKITMAYDKMEYLIKGVYTGVSKQKFKDIIDRQGKIIKRYLSTISRERAIKLGYIVADIDKGNDWVIKWVYIDSEGIRHLVDNDGYKICKGSKIIISDYGVVCWGRVMEDEESIWDKRLQDVEYTEAYNRWGVPTTYKEVMRYSYDFTLLDASTINYKLDKEGLTKVLIENVSALIEFKHRYNSDKRVFVPLWRIGREVDDYKIVDYLFQFGAVHIEQRHSTRFMCNRCNRQCDSLFGGVCSWCLTQMTKEVRDKIILREDRLESDREDIIDTIKGGKMEIHKEPDWIPLTIITDKERW